MNTLGERIKYVREKILDMSQSQLAMLLSLKTRQSISEYENDKTEPPVGTLREISEKAGISLSWLIDGEDQKKPENEPKTDIISEPPNGYASGELQKIVELLKQLPEAVAPVQELLEAKLRQKQALKQINDI